jgi:hypothetical protein
MNIYYVYTYSDTGFMEKRNILSLETRLKNKYMAIFFLRNAFLFPLWKKRHLEKGYAFSKCFHFGGLQKINFIKKEVIKFM